MNETKQILFHDRLFTDFYLYLLSRTAGSGSQSYSAATSCFTVFLVLSGSGILHTGIDRLRLEAGQWTLISPGVPVSCHAVSRESWDYIRIGFAGHRAARILSFAGIGEGNTVYSHADCLLLEHLIGPLLSSASSLEEILTRQSAVCRILSVLVGDSLPVSRTSPFGQNPYVARAVEYIGRHYQEPLSIQDLADWLGITRNYLFSLFKQELHCSPRRYILDLRLKRACHLLRQTEYSVEAIALSCGYQDPAIFSRTFMGHIGQSPAAYRRSCIINCRL